jgi:hypothetical protein
LQAPHHHQKRPAAAASPRRRHHHCCLPAQIGESLKRFGVGDDTTALLVARYDAAPQDVRGAARPKRARRGTPPLRRPAQAGAPFKARRTQAQRGSRGLRLACVTRVLRVPAAPLPSLHGWRQLEYVRGLVRGREVPLEQLQEVADAALAIKARPGTAAGWLAGGGLGLVGSLGRGARGGMPWPQQAL